MNKTVRSTFVALFSATLMFLGAMAQAQTTKEEFLSKWRGAAGICRMLSLFTLQFNLNLRGFIFFQEN